jgi:hypothetical protein
VPQFFPFLARQKCGRDEDKQNKHQQDEKDKHESGGEEIHVAWNCTPCSSKEA